MLYDGTEGASRGGLVTLRREQLHCRLGGYRVVAASGNACCFHGYPALANGGYSLVSSLGPHPVTARVHGADHWRGWWLNHASCRWRRAAAASVR